jgi:hypothetical protein
MPVLKIPEVWLLTGEAAYDSLISVRMSNSLVDVIPSF